MDELHKQVRRAHRRLEMQRFLGVLTWSWFIAMCLALALVAVGKYRPWGLPDWSWLAGGAVAGLLAAIVWMKLTRRSALGAAIEIDHRFELKERVSSAFALHEVELESAAGQALASDAARRVARLDVGSRFPTSAPRHFWLPLLPAATAVLVALFVAPMVEETANASAAVKPQQQQIKKATEELRKALAKRSEMAEKQKLEDATDLFKKIEDQAAKLQEGSQEPKQLLVKLNDLSRELESRRRGLEGLDAVKRQMEQMKAVERGPADKLADALSKSKFDEAAKALQELQKQLANSQLDDAQKKQLAKQFQQMQEKLAKLAEAQKQAQANAEQQRDDARKAGNQQQADQLSDELEKLMAQRPQMNALQELAQQLGQCSKCANPGQDGKPGQNGQNGKAGQNGSQGKDSQNAAQSFQQAQDAMNKLQQQLDEMKMLDEAMNQVQQCKSTCQGECPNCHGQGCSLCQGGQGQSNQKSDQGGNGLGPGDRGSGDRPETRTNTNAYDSRVRQQQRQGAADFGGFVEGPNIPGQAMQDIHTTREEAADSETDPLSGRHLPRAQQEHAREYFDMFREAK